MQTIIVRSLDNRIIIAGEKYAYKSYHCAYKGKKAFLASCTILTLYSPDYSHQYYLYGKDTLATEGAEHYFYGVGGKINRVIFLN